MAENATDDSARSTLLNVAEQYDELARKAEGRDD